MEQFDERMKQLHPDSIRNGELDRDTLQKQADQMQYMQQHTQQN